LSLKSWERTYTGPWQTAAVIFPVWKNYRHRWGHISYLVSDKTHLRCKHSVGWRASHYQTIIQDLILTRSLNKCFLPSKTGPCPPT
jgi:hypothetical protein